MAPPRTPAKRLAAPAEPSASKQDTQSAKPAPGVRGKSPLSAGLGPQKTSVSGAASLSSVPEPEEKEPTGVAFHEDAGPPPPMDPVWFKKPVLMTQPMMDALLAALLHWPVLDPIQVGASVFLLSLSPSFEQAGQEGSVLGFASAQELCSSSK